MSAPPRWDEALRAELVAAAARRRQRRQRPLQVAAALGACVVAVLAVLGLGPSEAAAEIRVERSGDRVVVTLLSLQEDPHDTEVELRAAGFDVAVELVPVGPSAVGRFVGAADSGALPAELVPLDASGTAFTAFSLPLGWDGSLRLYVGRPARAGEAYLGFSDALAPGEPLACLDLLGAPADVAAAAVADRPASVAFRRLDDPDAPPLGRDELRGPFAAWVVARADAIAPGEVIVWLVGDRHEAPTGGRTCTP